MSEKEAGKGKEDRKVRPINPKVQNRIDRVFKELLTDVFEFTEFSIDPDDRRRFLVTLDDAVSKIVRLRIDDAMASQLAFFDLIEDGTIAYDDCCTERLGWHRCDKKPWRKKTE